MEPLLLLAKACISKLYRRTKNPLAKRCFSKGSVKALFSVDLGGSTAKYFKPIMHKNFPTVDLRANTVDVCSYNVDLGGSTAKFTIEAENVSFGVESRNVNVEIESGSHQLLFHLNGEDAVELGMSLISHGTRALESLRIFHNLIFSQEAYQKYLREGRIDRVTLRPTNIPLPNHGPGFRHYVVIPEWTVGMAPQYADDFQYQDIIFWEPFPEEFAKQLDWFGVDVIIEEYDREADLELFRKTGTGYNQ